MAQNNKLSDLIKIFFTPALSRLRSILREPSNLPNLLTCSRILIVPLIIVLLYFDSRWLNLLTALLVVLAAITDGLDGYLARKNSFESTLGKLLDPLADKILLLSTMVMLVYLQRVPAWMVCLILCRETAITGLRAIAAERGVVIGASAMAKYKTIFQIVAVVALIIHYPFLGADAHSVGIFFFWIAFIYTMWTGYTYLRESFNLLMSE
ncbi:MAG: CDP-diacylglycerol--glycerol-3-phosphate 3-phosphatidyltransferase [Deltaproteobacteria bacterium]|nr:CDP-diacylglycerol--glycerol-3-phosphate 3-phosphatidyltransferase [Candidatus Tharpella sp.]